MKIAIGSDNAGFLMKNDIKKYVEGLGHEVYDFGTFSEESTDYPIYGFKVAKAVANKEYERGILICGTGVGMCITANKVKGIRAVVCSEPYSAKLAKEHNDSNILTFGARVVGVELAKMITFEWLNAEFQGGRHARRVDQIKSIENREKPH
ncbi:MAG: ribose 5-phosphate isomerase B [Oscillospiraceae bacterium]|nr:ribose 5-phosphate isomerase B [Oscillospiraceae bacterium]